MTPEQFNALDEMEQAELIWNGKHVGDRKDEEHNILLYKIDSTLFVEVFYHVQHNVIKKYTAFSKDELLDIYLPKN